MGVFYEFEIWPKFDLWNYCIVCNIMSCYTAIYQEPTLAIAIPPIRKLVCFTDYNTLRPRQDDHHFPYDIFKCIFVNVNVQLRCHWGLFPRVQLTIFQHRNRQWLGAGQVTSHYLKQLWLFHWRIYASLGLNELLPFLMKQAKFLKLTKHSLLMVGMHSR